MVLDITISIDSAIRFAIFCVRVLFALNTFWYWYMSSRAKFAISRAKELVHMFYDIMLLEVHRGRQAEKDEPSDMLTQRHIDLIASRRWKDVLVWIVFHREELYWLDKKKQSALHHACLFRAPAQIIEMLLYQTPELARLANQDNEIPLHWAVRLSVPKEVLKWLLAVYPRSGCEAKDKDGNTALSLVWEKHDTDLLNLWWSSGPQAVLDSTRWKSILFFLRCYSSSIPQDNSLSTMKDLEVAYEQLVRHDRHFQPLHTASRCPNVPSALFALMLQVYKGDLKVSDATGKLPLAVACLDPLNNRSVGALTKVHLMVSECPEAVLCRDHRGRLPLHIALESGLNWEEGIDRLIEVAPKSVLVNDPVSGLPCFLLAATGAERREKCFIADRKQRCNDELQHHSDQFCAARSVSTIFRLLRSDPAQLSLLHS